VQISAVQENPSPFPNLTSYLSWKRKWVDVLVPPAEVSGASAQPEVMCLIKKSGTLIDLPLQARLERRNRDAADVERKRWGHSIEAMSSQIQTSIAQFQGQSALSIG
jgi:hypothetical protein